MALRRLFLGFPASETAFSSSIIIGSITVRPSSPPVERVSLLSLPSLPSSLYLRKDLYNSAERRCFSTCNTLRNKNTNDEKSLDGEDPSKCPDDSYTDEDDLSINFDDSLEDSIDLSKDLLDLYTDPVDPADSVDSVDSLDQPIEPFDSLDLSIDPSDPFNFPIGPFDPSEKSLNSIDSVRSFENDTTTGYKYTQKDFPRSKQKMIRDLPRSRKLALAQRFDRIHQRKKGWTLEEREKNLEAKRLNHERPLKIVFFGSSDFAIPSLKALLELEKQGEIAALDICTKNEHRGGRGNKHINKTPTLKFAQEHNLPYFTYETNKHWLAQIPDHIKSPLEFSGTPYDLCITVSFGAFIPSYVIKMFSHGGLNVHPSLLPRFRGPAPIQWALFRGDIETGVTIQTLDPEKYDSGTILDRQYQKINRNMDYQKLHDILSERSAVMLTDFILNRKFLKPKPIFRPGRLRSCYAPKLGKKDMNLSLEGVHHAENSTRAWGAVNAVLDYKHNVKVKDVWQNVFRIDPSVKEHVPYNFFHFGDKMLVKCADNRIVSIGSILYKNKWISGGEFVKSYNFGKGGMISPS